MNVLSLFDGMSCGLQALKQAGIPVTNYFASEIDKYTITISKKNHPEIIHIGDVTKVETRNGNLLVDGKEYKIDLVIGGSPCQGFSFAGKQLNFSDPRSKLFFEFVRLKNELSPKYFLLENVRMKQEYEDVINEHLKVRPFLINSSLVSAQNRNRLYWTNISKIEIIERDLKWSDVMEIDAKNVYYVTEKMMNWINNSPERQKKFKIYTSETNTKMQMLEASHYKGISNQRCFAIADKKGFRYISPIECERLQTLPDNYTEGVSNTQRYKMLGNGWTVSVIEHIFKSIDN